MTPTTEQDTICNAVVTTTKPILIRANPGTGTLRRAESRSTIELA